MGIYSSINKAEESMIYPNYYNNLEEWLSSDSLFNSYRYFKNERNFKEHKWIWLNQFLDCDKEVIQNFLLSNLVYISEEDIDNSTRIVSDFLSRKIIPKLIRNISEVKIYNIFSRLIFMGLSDGARLDLLRYNNKQFANYQFVLETEISDKRCKRILKKLDNYPYPEEVNAIPVLVDDFIGSGISYLRFEDGVWKGKLVRFYQDSYPHLVYGNKKKILIIPYYATKEAVRYINENILKAIPDKSIEWYIYPLHYIDKAEAHGEVVRLLEKYYYQNPIDDWNYKMGKHEKPFLGFNESSLCLVFQHNVPNNSFPILWHSDRALFPRRCRHAIG